MQALLHQIQTKIKLITILFFTASTFEICAAELTPAPEVARNLYVKSKKVEALLNPEHGVQLLARVEASRLNLSLPDSIKHINSRINSYNEALRKSAPNYKASSDATYSKDIAMGLMKDLGGLGIGTLEKSHPGMAIFLLMASESKTVTNLFSRAKEDLFKYSYDQLNENFIGTKSKASQEVTNERWRAMQSLTQFAEEDYNNYLISPNYRQVFDETSKGQISTPTDTSEDILLRHPSLATLELGKSLESKINELPVHIKNELVPLFDEFSKKVIDRSDATRKKMSAQLTVLVTELEQQRLKAIEEEKKARNNEINERTEAQRYRTIRSGLRVINQLALISKDPAFAKTTEVINHLHNFYETVEEINSSQKKMVDLTKNINYSSTAANAEMSLQLISLGLNLVTSFMGQPNDPVLEALKIVLEQIQNLGKMMHERFDIVDAKLDFIISQIEELRSLVNENENINQARLIQIHSSLRQLSDEMNRGFYKVTTTTRELFDENLRGSVAVLMRSKTIDDEKLYKSTLTRLSEWANINSKKEQRTLPYSTDWQLEDKIRELKTRDSSELGALVYGELLNGQVGANEIEHTSVNTKDWSASSGFLCDLLKRKASSDKSFVVDEVTKEDIEKSIATGESYINSFNDLLNSNPRILLEQLELYKAAIKNAQKVVLDSSNLALSNEKESETVQTSGSYEELLKSAEKLKQPKWGEIRGYDAFMESAPKLSEYEYPVFEKVPENVWNQLDPKLKLLSHISLPNIGQLKVRYVLDEETVYDPSGNAKKIESLLKDKIIYGNDGKTIITKKSVPYFTRTDWPMSLPKIYWIFSLTEQGHEEIISIFKGDINTIPNKIAGIFLGFLPRTPHTLTTNKDLRDLVLNKLNYQSHTKTGRIFDYIDIPYVKKGGVYLESKPKGASAEEIEYKNLDANVHQSWKSYGTNKLIKTPVWLINLRMNSLNSTIADWQKERSNLNRESALLNQDNLGSTFDVLNKETQFRTLLILRSIDVLYPQLSEEEKEIIKVALSGIYRLYTAEDLLNLYRGRQYSLSEVDKEIENRIQTARDLLTHLSSNQYIAPPHMQYTLYKLIEAKSQ